MTIPTPSAEPEDDVIEVMCRAHDTEDAAQRGEPSPWDFTYGDGDPYGDDPDGVVEFATFKADRLAAMRAALSASGLLERERVLREAATAFLHAYEPPSSYDDMVVWSARLRGTVADLRTALSNPLKTETKS